MARVAIVMSNFWPEPTGGAPTCTEFAVYLQRAGHDVTVVTSMPYYPQWRIWPDYRSRVWSSETHEGVRILRSWHYVSARVSTLVRTLHEITLSLVALPNVVRALAAADIVYLYTPALSFAWVGSLVARLLKVPRVVVVKDVMPDAAIELGMLKNSALITLSKAMAKSLYDHAEETLTLGEGMRRRIASVAKHGSRVTIVSDTVDGSELYPIPFEENEFRKRFVPAGTFAVLHTGNMGKKQDLGLILRAAALLRDQRDVHFYVFGEGAVKEEFLAERARQDLTNVSHYPLQERPFLKHMLSGADVVLVSQLRTVVDIVVPSKLLTAMISGAMIVAACPPGSAPEAILQESGGGLIVPAEEEIALVNAIERVRSGQVDATLMRHRAREFALKRFERSAVYGPIASQLHARFARLKVPDASLASPRDARS